MIMKKYSAIFTTFLLLGVVTGCGGKKDTTPKEFKPHEVEYGGDTTTTLSGTEFLTAYQNDYQKYNKYKNALVTLKSDKSFYDQNDRDEYFKDFDEIKFVAILNDEDRSMALGKLFELIPINIDITKLNADVISYYRVGRAISTFKRSISMSTYDQYFDTFYQYKVLGNGVEITFSRDYYPVHATFNIDFTNYTLDFLYYNVDDLPNQTGEVDQETFLIHAIARANQKLIVNALEAELTLKNTYIDEIMKIDEELDVIVVAYESGSGTASCCYKLDSIGLDQTAFPILYDFNRKTSEYKEPTYSDNFTDSQKGFIHYRYFQGMFPSSGYLFDSYRAIIDSANGAGWGNDVRKAYTVSPLAVNQKVYIDGQLNKSYNYEFNDDGLLSYLGINGNADYIDEISYRFTYSTI